MTKDEILSFIKSHPVFQLATIDGNKPRVRSMTLYRVDERGLVFHTHTTKDLHQQLNLNPNIEMCFTRVQPALEVRLCGSVEVIEDANLKEQLDPQETSTVVVYCVKNGVATVWAKESEHEPKTFVQL